MEAKQLKNTKRLFFNSYFQLFKNIYPSGNKEVYHFVYERTLKQN